LRLVNLSITPHWELVDGKQVRTLDPTGPVVGDNPEVVLHSVLSALGIARLPCYAVVDAFRKARSCMCCRAGGRVKSGCSC
jgi:DNA-binding transcriptional LysR family regulator